MAEEDPTRVTISPGGAIGLWPHSPWMGLVSHSCGQYVLGGTGSSLPAYTPGLTKGASVVVSISCPSVGYRFHPHWAVLLGDPPAPVNVAMGRVLVPYGRVPDGLGGCRVLCL